jgi:hypothetical protein
MHFVWKADFENEAAYTRASIDNPRALDGLKLTAGEPIAGGLPLLRLEITTSFPPADYFNAGPVFVVSHRLRQVFDEFGVSAEYFLVTLMRNGQEIGDGQYFFANLLEKIDCLDRERSTYTIDGEYVDTIKNLAIDENKAHGRPLFRLAKTYDMITLVSEPLAKALDASGITGVKFVDPKDWKW